MGRTQSTYWLRGGCVLKRNDFSYTDAIDEHLKVRNKMESQYFMIKVYPLMQKILQEKFGSDVTNIIVYYSECIKMSDWEIRIEHIICDLYRNEIAQIVLMYIYSHEYETR